ncbi:hypothetical protein PHMEG_00024026 [Phytophthora megakarya]|uniref:Uncharacterized protein n=1 Tax=Phytophthora megakarya TaxID=4795 RepID=A0A225VFH8_9STRA|nr:hypothetical protein PHMEG_00024026 [Phytophthora megakarya]
MDEALRPWDLYDLSGAQSPDTLDNMKGYFRRFRGLRQKTIEGVEYVALQTSWCAFIKRWNLMLLRGESFVDWLVNREDILAEHSLSDLRARVCGNAWEDMRRTCYVSVAEGCDACIGRTSEAEWQRHVAEYPLGEQENAWIQRYRRSLVENAQASSRREGRQPRSRQSSSPPPGGRMSRRRPRSRSRSQPRRRVRRRLRSRSRSPSSRSHSPGSHPGRPVGELSAVPTYRRQPGVRAIVPYNAAQVEAHDWREPTHEVDPRDPRYGPRSSAIHRSSQLSEADPRDGTGIVPVGRDEVDEALNRFHDAQLDVEEALRRSGQAQGTAAEIRQSNREILMRLRDLEVDRWGQARTGTRRRADHGDGGGGEHARAARRAGRSTHAPQLPEVTRGL